MDLKIFNIRIIKRAYLLILQKLRYNVRSLLNAVTTIFDFP